MHTEPSIACMSEVFPLPTAPQTPTKLPFFKEKSMLRKVVTVSGTSSSSGCSSNNCFSGFADFKDGLFKLLILFEMPNVFFTPYLKIDFIDCSNKN